MKEQQLDFRKGISNNPSDLTCDDNSLVRCENLYFDGIQHRPIQELVGLDVSISADTDLLFVHNISDGTKNYFFISGGASVGGYHLSFVSSQGGTGTISAGQNPVVFSNDVTIQAIGNILIVNDTNDFVDSDNVVNNKGLHYILWRDGSYNYLGQQIPTQVVDFCIKVVNPDGNDVASDVPGDDNTNTRCNNHFYAQNSTPTGGIVELVDAYPGVGFDPLQRPDNRYFVYGIPEGTEESEDRQKKYNDAMVGLYQKNIKALAVNRCFAEPFFVCTALELYDGSFIYQSAPQLVFPAVRRNSYVFCTPQGHEMTMRTFGGRLNVKCNYDYSAFSDIVKDVVVFVTDGAYIYDTTVDQKPQRSFDTFSSAGSADTYLSKKCHDFVARGISSGFPYDESSQHTYNRTFFPFKELTDNDIIKNIKSCSIFYKLCSLGIKRVDSDYIDTAEFIDRHTIDTITTQQQLPIDFYSRSKLAPAVMKAINGRLNIANIKRGYAPIENNLLPFTAGTSNVSTTSPVTSQISVAILTQSGERKVVAPNNQTTSQRLDLYFFYPDPRAKFVQMNIGTTAYKYKLEEHSSLNGAYYLHALPNAYVEVPASDSTETLPSGTTPEILQSQLYVSEVNNPFTFRPENAVQIGTGRVLDLASLTTALSQGQFGQYPLIAFTDSGIWALSVGGTGVYSAAHPMSREVLIDGNHPLETDGAVFFTSKKGLMLINGNQVSCVSEQLSGKAAVIEEAHEEEIGGINWTVSEKDGPCALTFQSCFMAYDYRDSLIYIFPQNPQTRPASVPSGYTAGRYALVFSIKGGTFSTKMFPSEQYTSIISHAVADYPDYILQSGTTLLSFISRSDINRDTVTTTEGNTSVTAARTYDAVMLSRPLKLENGLALKSIMQVRHIMDLHPAEEEEDDDEEEPTEETDDQSEETGGESGGNEGAGDEPTGGDGASNDTGASLVFGLEGSNNAKKWCPLHSLRGVPWKYYRFKYTFTGLKATDTFSGTVVLTEERRANKLR